MESDVKSDCLNCFALCCVSLPYMKSNDFPYDKDSGEPCRHLCSDHRCSIHGSLREKGFQGCVSYECFGAGQKVSQVVYKGKDWREDSRMAEEMFSVFPIVHQLHEMLFYLKQAIELEEAKDLKLEIQTLYDLTYTLTIKKPEEILALDIEAHRSKINPVFIKVSDIYRSQYRKKRKGSGTKKKRVDYIGANLANVDMKGHDLRGTFLIAANLTNSDLRRVDFIGADLRDADLSGANLAGALFLTQSQIQSAKGDETTVLPDYVERPRHWGS
ncbi:pentapeptide repeat-containing protein [Shouchella clausii]|uniref:pentapeptide repeat-containing protein n=1 Tax=Shouchella clausii TaxID=79880 RepID=UPI0031FE2B84